MYAIIVGFTLVVRVDREHIFCDPFPHISKRARIISMTVNDSPRSL